MNRPAPSPDGPPLRGPSLIARRAAAGLGLAAACLVLTLGSTGCITETEGSVRSAHGLRTEGVIVQGSPDAVWQKVQAVLGSMTRSPLETRGLERSIVTTVRGSEVKVLVEAHGPSTTAVHVTSSDRSLADSIRLRIMR